MADRMGWNVAQAQAAEPELDDIDALRAAFPVSAGSFIVTLYGDVVAAGGGEVWMGNIVETCAEVGIAESRARTAVSRLMAAGRIAGEKIGRRSYYRLTPTAEREFQAAADLIYAPVRLAPLRGWHLVLLPEDGEGEVAARLSLLRFGQLHQKLAILPDRGQALPRLPPCHLRATSPDDLGAALRTAWPLEELAARMNAFIAGFGPMETHDPSCDQVVGLRLLLVHVFRRIALTDPLLPPDCLPENWPGERARALFARLYARLSPMAEASVARRFRDRHGLLRLDPRQCEARLVRVTAGLGPEPVGDVLTPERTTER